MWVKRADYETLRERALRAEMRIETLDLHKKSLIGRVRELEAAILAANDAAHKVHQEVAARPPVPVNLAALFEDEDPDLVEADRQRAKEEGTTDGLLASMDE